jgi:hypothetical protein
VVRYPTRLDPEAQQLGVNAPKAQRLRRLGDYRLRAAAARLTSTLAYNMNDPARFRQRVQIAKKYLSRFGLAAPCGFGRENPSTLPALLQSHVTALEIVNASG